MKDSDLLAFHYAHSISFLLNALTLAEMSVFIRWYHCFLINSPPTLIILHVKSLLLIPRGRKKGIFIEKAALEQCREFLSSLVLPLGLTQADLEAAGWSFGCSPPLAED